MKIISKIFFLLFLTITLVDAQTFGVGSVKGKWIAGDFHQHSYYTDGSHILDEVIETGFMFGLDFQANSEHGGYRIQDGYNHFWDDPSYYPNNPIKGDFKESNGHQAMWRWQSLSEYVYPHVQILRNKNRDKLILTGVEWNVPSHEHCNIMIEDLNDFPYVAVFEYYFDGSDVDTSHPFTGDWLPEKRLINNHEKSIAAAKWLQDNFAGYSWLIPTHPERKNLWHIEDFRDLNNVAPDVAFGFDGMPGHQKETNRGGFDPDSAIGGGTYGGAGYFIAKVGGLWDTLLGEGRRWFTFVNSDFHDTHGDFWPGEYAKTYVFAYDLNNNGKFDTDEIVKALQSGNSFAVHGDLINTLEFTAKSGSSFATMGSDLNISRNSDIEITVAYKSPEKNNNGDKPIVHHIDLIAGEITGKVNQNSVEYTKDTNETTRVLKRFNSNEFKKTSDGWNRASVKVKIDKNKYFRLRGTNLAPNTPGETDFEGNPLLDFEQKELDGEDEAWNDLWFYSNPIFVYVK
jgi:hypothetical protein